LRKGAAFGLRRWLWRFFDFVGQVAYVVVAPDFKRRLRKFGRWFFLCRDAVQLTTGLMSFVSDFCRRS
jgi:hypothetical protein